MYVRVRALMIVYAVMLTVFVYVFIYNFLCHIIILASHNVL